MNMLIIEVIILCFLFTLMVFMLAREPIKTLYNYPPKIQERVKTLEMYKDQIPTQGNKVFAKVGASIIIILIVTFIMKYVNGYDNFIDGFKYSFILWSIVNIYDAVVLDCIWFCHDKRFVFKGTEDMVKEYHNYGFHIKGALIGEIIGLIACVIVGALVEIL